MRVATQWCDSQKNSANRGKLQEKTYSMLWLGFPLTALSLSYMFLIERVIETHESSQSGFERQTR